MLVCWEAITDVIYVEDKENRMAVFDNGEVSVRKLSDSLPNGKSENDDSSLFKAKSGRCAKRKFTNLRSNYALACLTQQD